VDDVVVKTRNSDTLIADLEETFASLREYCWKLKPEPNHSDPPAPNIEDPHRAARFRYTNSIPTIREVYDIIKGMRSKAAPAPDGLNAAFYKASWNWIKDDVYKVVTDFYDLGTILMSTKPILLLFLKSNNPSFPKIIGLLVYAMLSIKSALNLLLTVSRTICLTISIKVNQPLLLIDTSLLTLF
jgi:hypothetical protein